MILYLSGMAAGLLLMVWSADRFVDGAAATAKHLGMPPLLIGMLIVGFGTSAPEMLVSAMSSLQGNPGIALGNAYGSNIANISLILGLTALVSPIYANSEVLKTELPVLTLVTAVAVYQAFDKVISTYDAVVLLLIFFVFMGWSVIKGKKKTTDSFAGEVELNVESKTMGIGKAVFWLVIGLLLLMASSRLLVWGAVNISRLLGVSDLVIGLTVVAVGTSLPELASSLMAARKGEHDIALGNVLGSNLFNTLVVVGIAGSIAPLEIAPEVLKRDMPVMGALTVSLFIICYGFKGRQGQINRYEGLGLLLSYAAYSLYLIRSCIHFT